MIVLTPIFPIGPNAEDNFLVHIITLSSDLWLSSKCSRYISLLFISISMVDIPHNSQCILFDSSGVPYSKPLYTLSYTFITAGASGALLTAIYFIVSL